MSKTPPDPRYEHKWICDIRKEDQISGKYLVKEKWLRTTRRGEPYLSIVLADKTGEIEARVWDRAEEFSKAFEEGEVVQVEGQVGSYKDQIQVNVTTIMRTSDKIDPQIFVESSPRDCDEMFAALKGLLKRIKNQPLRRLIERFFGDREFVHRFKRAPAAKNFHHSYLGGLLEHTLSVCEMAVRVAEHYPQLDRDLLLAGAFLHDVGKIRELSYSLLIDYTDEGRLLGHLALGAQMVDEKISEIKDFPKDTSILLKHLILSHHGEFEFGSPKRPKFLEAFALHLIDDLDAKLNGLSRFMEKDKSDGAWTEFNRLFGRYFLKGRLDTSRLDQELDVEKEGDQETLSLF